MSEVLNLTVGEVRSIIISLQETIENTALCLKDPKIPWNPEARRHMDDIKSNAESALIKISTMSGIAPSKEGYKPGDEMEFLTKES